MKFTKIAFAAVFALSFGRAYAFHSGGVAECDGCHTMHNSVTEDSMTASEAMQPDGTVNRGVGVTGAFLLQGNDVSSTCLICHGRDGAGSYHVFAPSTTAGAIDTTKLNFTPGGDFSWLKRDFLYTLRGSVISDPGKRHGHSVIAQDFGLSADSRLAPPGGTDPVGGAGAFSQAFTGANFSCVSCHDPHGKKRLTATDTFVTTGSLIKGSGSYGGTAYIAGVDPNATSTAETAGAYRLLGGAGWAPKSNQNDTFTAFLSDPPIALAPSTYNQSESTYAGKQSAKQVIVVYGSGMSEWCQNCHPAMHSDKSISTGTKSGEFLRHPAGSTAKMSAVVAANYNNYVKSGDLTATDNYDSLIPFETGQTRAQIQTTNAPSNSVYVAVSAGTNANPMCLSCHRAHASAFGSMMRWNMENEFIVSAGAYKTEPTGGRDAATMQAGMYMRPASAYATYQRSLCNKCHAKD
jgi:hypothetical protein